MFRLLTHECKDERNQCTPFILKRLLHCYKNFLGLAQRIGYWPLISPLHNASCRLHEGITDQTGKSETNTGTTYRAVVSLWKIDVANCEEPAAKVITVAVYMEEKCYNPPLHKNPLTETMKLSDD